MCALTRKGSLKRVGWVMELNAGSACQESRWRCQERRSELACGHPQCGKVGFAPFTNFALQVARKESREPGKT